MRRPRFLVSWWPTLLLAILNGAGVLGCVLLLWQGSALPSMLATPPRRLAAPQGFADLDRPLPDLAILQDTALFHESRTFYVPPALPELQNRPDYRLSGTLVIPGQAAAALLTHNPTGARRKVREGDDLEGWTVDAIRVKALVLRHGEQQLEIRSAPPAVMNRMSGAP